MLLRDSDIKKVVLQEEGVEAFEVKKEQARKKYREDY